MLVTGSHCEPVGIAYWICGAVAPNPGEQNETAGIDGVDEEFVETDTVAAAEGRNGACEYGAQSGRSRSDRRMRG